VTAARAAKTRAIAQRNTTFALEAPAIWVELTGIGSVRWPLTEYQERARYHASELVLLLLP
jgi:hypothetical protein